MKLVEILARELKEWPEGVACIAQNEDAVVVRLKSIDVVYKNEIWVGLDGKSIIGFGDVSQLATDHASAIVTRTDWQAERARIAKPDSKPNKDGWIRHRGGKCPVAAGVLVDYRMRDGEIDEFGHNAGRLSWSHNSGICDIMAYRIHKPAEQGIYADDKDESSEPAQVTYVDYDGPLQWRDRITEIDRTVEALEEERVSLVQRLEVEGFRLIERVVQPVEDMSDPANWRKGDLITFVEEVSDRSFTTGKQYIFEELSGYGSAGVLADDEGDENGWAVEFFKFHSRPSK